MNRQTIMLFISTESPTHSFARRQVELACAQAFAGACPGDLKVVDVGVHPELAEKFNIEALPTVIVGERRIVGIPQLERLAEYLSGAMRER